MRAWTPSLGHARLLRSELVREMVPGLGLGLKLGLGRGMGQGLGLGWDVGELRNLTQSPS